MMIVGDMAVMHDGEARIGARRQRLAVGEVDAALGGVSGEAHGEAAVIGFEIELGVEIGDAAHMFEDFEMAPDAAHGNRRIERVYGVDQIRFRAAVGDGGADIAVAVGRLFDGAELVERFEAVSAKLGEVEDSDEMNDLIEQQAELQENIEAADAWDLERRVEIAMDALRCPPADQDVKTLDRKSVV